MGSNNNLVTFCMFIVNNLYDIVLFIVELKTKS